MSNVDRSEPRLLSGTAADSEIEQVVNSNLFRKSASLRDLLLSLWKHRHTPISEYAIGVEVLGRRADFDPKSDATVRVQISRLRQRLKDYYESEGRSHSRRIQIPLGEYRVEFVEAAPPVGTSLPTVVNTGAGRARWTKLALSLLVAAVLLLAIDNVRLRRAATPSVPGIHPFWQPLARRGTPLPIVVPAPLFFRWGEQPFVARDFRVSTPEQLEDSSFLILLRDKYGKPETNQLYTVASDTVAASSLSRYLEDRGVPAAVVDTPTATLDLLATRDAIVFVGPGSTPELGPVMENMNFYVKPNGGGVFNRAPQPGEPARFTDTQHAPLRTTGHGILARLPGRAPGTQVLLFASSYNPALVSLLTTPAELDAIQAFHSKHGDTPFYEIVIRYERNADRVLRANAIAHRAVTASR